MNNNGNLLLCPTSHRQESFIFSSKRRMCENQTLPSRELEQNPVDGRNPSNQLIGVYSLFHYLQGFVHPRWLFGISAINSRDDSESSPKITPTFWWNDDTSEGTATFSCYTNNGHVRKYLEKMRLEPLKLIKICEAPCIVQTFHWTSWARLRSKKWKR